MELHASRVDSRCASNLDASGCAIVRRGALVSYGGLRLRVHKVRTGHFLGYPVGLNGEEQRSNFDTFPCRCVRVLSS